MLERELAELQIEWPETPDVAARDHRAARRPAAPPLVRGTTRVAGRRCRRRARDRGADGRAADARRRARPPRPAQRPDRAPRAPSFDVRPPARGRRSRDARAGTPALPRARARGARTTRGGVPRREPDARRHGLPRRPARHRAARHRHARDPEGDRFGIEVRAAHGRRRPARTSSPAASTASPTSRLAAPSRSSRTSGWPGTRCSSSAATGCCCGSRASSTATRRSGSPSQSAKGLRPAKPDSIACQCVTAGSSSSQHR